MNLIHSLTIPKEGGVPIMEYQTEHDLGSLKDVFEDYLMSFGMKISSETQRKLLKEIFDAKEAFDPVCALYYKGTVIVVPRETIDEVKTLALVDVYRDQINFLSL